MKRIEDMTVAELWDLFPITFAPYNPAYTHWYHAETEALAVELGEVMVRVNHIGSTAVEGLMAKPIVDILLEVHPSADPEALAARLESLGWTLMNTSSAEDLRVTYNKGYTPHGYADRVFHLHVRSWADWDELYFRDYLRDDLEARQQYERLKHQLRVVHGKDRDAYTEGKTEFCRRIVKEARQRYGARYSPKNTSTP